MKILKLKVHVTFKLSGQVLIFIACLLFVCLFIFADVKILHLISLPFPKCWHKLCDDEPAIDNKVVQDLLKIFQVFVVEYFGLSVI